VDLYESNGQDPQLDPYTGGAFDISSAGSVKMLGWLNRGYRVITNFRRPSDGLLVKFPRKEATLLFQTSVITGTLVSATSTTVTFDGSASGTADVHNGWYLEITGGTGSGQIRMVVDYDTSRTGTVHLAWDTTPDSTSTYLLSKREMKIANPLDSDASYHITADPANSIASILKIVDLEYQKEIPHAGRVESFAGSIKLSARPSAWYDYGNGIVWDVAPEEAVWYLMEYEREFTALELASDEPQIPLQWQEALYLWCLWKVRTWSMEPNAAYGAKRDFYDFVSSLKLPQETMFDRTDSNFRVEV